jgi:acyl-coenzyme A synthetase/AMP-(fatty) acid ligase
MIAQSIFDWARRTPEKTALIYNGHGVSYRGLADQISLATEYFARLGFIGPGYAVLAVRNLMETWILGLGLRALGFDTISVGSSKTFTQLRLPNIRCVVTSSLEHWPLLSRSCASRNVPLVAVTLKAMATRGHGSRPAWIKEGGHVLLTSGTTGTKKMVLMTPEIDAVFVPAVVRNLGVRQNSGFCVFNFLPWTAVSHRCAASPWLVGGTTIIEQGNASFQALFRPETTHAMANPVILDRILAIPSGGFPSNDSLILAIGGGAITQPQFEQAKDRITPRLINNLASTEGGMIGITPLSSREDLVWHRIVPGPKVEIVDDEDRPVEVGKLGRVRIGNGCGPVRYLDDRTATAEVFRDGYFYSGDLAVIRSDGRMALQGRASDVIHLNGSKFPAAIIEDAIRDQFGLSVSLISRPGEHGGEEVHLIAESATPDDAQKLIAEIAKANPILAHAHIHYVARLPRNEMGKINRAELRNSLIKGFSSNGSA